MSTKEEPRGLNEAKVASVIKEMLIRTQFADDTRAAEFASIIAPMMREYRKPVVVKALRELGDILSPDERRALGIAGRASVGRRFAEALTDKGKADPKRAAECIVGEVFTADSRHVQRWLIFKEKSLAYIKIWGDDKDCSQSRSYAKTVVPWDDLPFFPLARCDADHCRCSFERYSERIHGPLELLNHDAVMIREEAERKKKGKETALGCLVILVIVAVVWLLAR